MVTCFKEKARHTINYITLTSVQIKLWFYKANAKYLISNSNLKYK